MRRASVCDDSVLHLRMVLESNNVTKGSNSAKQSMHSSIRAFQQYDRHLNKQLQHGALVNQEKSPADWRRDIADLRRRIVATGLANPDRLVDQYPFLGEAWDAAPPEDADEL